MKEPLKRIPWLAFSVISLSYLRCRMSVILEITKLQDWLQYADEWLIALKCMSTNKQDLHVFILCTANKDICYEACKDVVRK